MVADHGHLFSTADYLQSIERLKKVIKLAGKKVSSTWLKRDF